MGVARELSRDVARGQRTKSLAIYQDLVFYTAPDGYVVGLDARTGKLRWEAPTGRAHTSGPLVVNGMVISGGACMRDVTPASRPNCFIAAHDALTGKERWRFYTTPAPGEPGDETWHGVPLEKRRTSPWGFQGSYDPDRKLIYWGVANPNPDPRYSRHKDISVVPLSTPAELYSESTVALEAATGKLAWYFQHLPADDWDLDHTHERTLLRAAFNPDPESVKWINPDIPRGEERDMVVTVPEGGGIWALDRGTGQFLWQTPFPYDDPLQPIVKIDVKTGKTHVNPDMISTGPGSQQIVSRISLAPPPPPQPSRILQPERPAPLADRLVRDVDAALGEEVLDVPKTEAEPVVQPHRVTDDFRRESVSSVARHTATVPRRHSS